ncbi:MAG: hypothetical protein ACI4RO_03725, partial [Candidatus Scatosoma sp.]
MAEEIKDGRRCEAEKELPAEETEESAKNAAEQTNAAQEGCCGDKKPCGNGDKRGCGDRENAEKCAGADAVKAEKREKKKKLLSYLEEAKKE